MSAGRSPKQKGNRNERALVNFLLDAGFPAERCPLSGAAPGKYSGYDLTWKMLGRDFKIETKHHGNGFKKLYRWLERVDFLIVRADHSAPLVVMPIATVIELARAAERNGTKKS